MGLALQRPVPVLVQAPTRMPLHRTEPVLAWVFQRQLGQRTARGSSEREETARLQRR